MIVRRANMSDGCCSDCNRKADYCINLAGTVIRVCDLCFRELQHKIDMLPVLCPTCGQPDPSK